jgi:hypothetical protein
MRAILAQLLRHAVVAMTIVASGCVTVGQPKDPLHSRVNAVISKVHQRPVKEGKDTPWVIMHAVIAYENDLDVVRTDGSRVNAVEYLLKSATYDGKPIYRDNGKIAWLPTRDTTPGFKTSFLIQDHVDQFLFAYADAVVPLSAELVSDSGKRYTLADQLEESRAGFRDNQELGWTLVVLAQYHPFDKPWTARSGKTYRVEDVLALAIKRDPRRETEGGPHHLYGVAYCLNKYLAQGGKLEGTWADADAYLKTYIGKAKEWQQADGSFSGAVFRSNRPSPSARHMMSVTGHFLEWMSVAMTPEELRQEWVRSAVVRIVTLLEENEPDAFSMGGLYHAAHALRRYRAAVWQ